MELYIRDTLHLTYAPLTLQAEVESFLGMQRRAQVPSNQDQMGGGREWRLWAEGTAYAKLYDRGTEGLAGTQDGRGEKHEVREAGP